MRTLCDLQKYDAGLLGTHVISKENIGSTVLNSFRLPFIYLPFPQLLLGLTKKAHINFEALGPHLDTRAPSPRTRNEHRPSICVLFRNTKALQKACDSFHARDFAPKIPKS
jgi:hypothetical protein